jgi:hypothetical protein
VQKSSLHELCQILRNIHSYRHHFSYQLFIHVSKWFPLLCSFKRHLGEKGISFGVKTLCIQPQFREIRVYALDPLSFRLAFLPVYSRRYWSDNHHKKFVNVSVHTILTEITKQEYGIILLLFTDRKSYCCRKWEIYDELDMNISCHHVILLWRHEGNLSWSQYSLCLYRWWHSDHNFWCTPLDVLNFLQIQRVSTHKSDDLRHQLLSIGSRDFIGMKSMRNVVR